MSLKNSVLFKMPPRDMTLRIILFLCVLNAASSLNTVFAQYTPSDQPTVSLNGTWFFSLDQLANGEQEKRFSSQFPTSRWDTVTVPHCFSADKRFEFYTGKCWYRRSFQLSPQADKRLILHFDAVYYRCKIWLNNTLIGSHEGGYTPFKFDITAASAKGNNTLVLQVDNSWSTSTMPGAKPAQPVGDAPINQMFAWIPYGGIVRPVYITEEPAAYISALKVDAQPDLSAGTADVTVITFIENTSDQAVSLSPQVLLTRNETSVAVKRVVSKPVTIHPHTAGELTWTARLNAGDVNLWDPETPNLYSVRVIAANDTVQTNFGIRKLEVKGTQLLLNGKPVKRGGANRVIDYPDLGSKEPDSILERDMILMKAAGMTFQRIYHHPASEYLLSLADRYGMLIIEENGNTALKASQLSDTAIQNNFKRQYAEMVKRDWNHPSVIAWSVGNEFDSDTPEGVAWVKDMKAYSKSVDGRLVTFASNRTWNKTVTKAADEAGIHADFVSVNIYDDHLVRIRRVHELYPDKPVFISEFGYRTDRVKNEDERIKNVNTVLNVVRANDYVIGASVWTFNDYRSNYIGTNPNGFRPWGVVDPLRKIRPLYSFLQQEYCPVMLSQRGAVIQTGANRQVVLVLEGRTDFPAYTVRKLNVRWGTAQVAVPEISPGQQVAITISGTQASGNRIELVDSNNFIIAYRNLE